MATSLHLPEDLTILKDPHLIGPGCEKDTAREQERCAGLDDGCRQVVLAQGRATLAEPSPDKDG